MPYNTYIHQQNKNLFLQYYLPIAVPPSTSRVTLNGSTTVPIYTFITTENVPADSSTSYTVSANSINISAFIIPLYHVIVLLLFRRTKKLCYTYMHRYNRNYTTKLGRVIICRILISRKKNQSAALFLHWTTTLCIEAS